MATFDQLPAEQRAIIELVVARGRSYDALADVLQVSAQRVRELARDALVELAPVTGGRVDPQWRGQVADYLLGQQSGAESTATQAHLKRSETARAWALSLLDALDTLYANGDRPAIPDAEAGAEAEAEAAAEAEAVVEEPVAAERERERERERDKERDRDRERDRERDSAPAGRQTALSPAAQSALRRRRIYGAIAGLVVAAAIVVGILALAGVFSSDNSSNNTASSTTPSSPAPSKTGTTPAGGAQTQVQGQIKLSPLNGAKASGVAYILKQGNKQVLAVTAKLPPLPSTQRKAAYNVWLYNSQKDALSIGAQFTNAQGDYQGVGQLPANYKRYKFIDVSIQPFNNKTGHSGNSVLRGAFSSLAPVPQSQLQPPAGSSTTPGG